MQEESTAKLVTAHANTALSAFARRHSVGLGLYSGGEHPEVGSGTCIRLGDSFFVATVAHNLLDLPYDAISIIHANRPGRERVPIRKVHTSGGRKGDNDDLGIIELDRAAARSLEKDFLTLDTIETSPIRLDQGWVFLYGFPAERIPKHRAMEGTYAFSPMGFITLSVPKNRYPDQADRDRDIVMEYPERGDVGTEGIPWDMPDPYGISGGSIWFLDPNEATPLVGAHNAKLIGIQRSWLRYSRLAIGCRISSWVGLVRARFPDLAT